MPPPTNVYYKPIEGLLSLPTNTEDGISLNVARYIGRASIVSVTLNVEGATGTDASAIWYIVSFRMNDKSVDQSLETVVPIMEGILRRHGVAAGTTGTAFGGNNEGGVRWEGFEPILPEWTQARLNLYAFQISGATVTLRMRAMLRIEEP